MFLYQKALILAFNTSISGNKLTFGISQHKPTNLKGYFEVKNRFKTLVLKITDIE